jgi:uncharacterized membrane protein YfcA
VRVSHPGLAIAAIALLAAMVTGALGYGFSSITVPLALLFLTNRVLNPALVLVEVGLNASVIWVNRRAVRRVYRRVAPVIIGLGPGILVGTLALSRISPEWLKLWTFAGLLPLILLQVAGYRRPIHAERSAGLAFGGGVGALYASTTISGPPLALALSNQGLASEEFRAALGLIRAAESTLTAVVYGWAGLFTVASAALMPFMLIGIAFGMPVGAWAIRHVPPETFRRICMSVEALVVAWGLSRLLIELRVASAVGADCVIAVVALIVSALLVHFFAWQPRVRLGK